MKFTDTMIRNLKTDKKTYLREGNGFTIRVLPSGVKTWLYVYTYEGKRKEMNLGIYPAVSLAEARVKYLEAVKLCAGGRDPGSMAQAEKEVRRKAPTVEDLVKEYLAKHAVHKRSGAADERLLKVEVVPEWGKRKAADVTKRDIILLLERIVERGSPAMSNQVLKVTRKMFNFAVERDIIQHTPFTSIKPLAPNNSRDRALSQSEIKTLWHRLDTASISDDVRRALKLVLVTAQRPGEVAGMHSGELEGRWWTIPSERAKNGRTHRVYLTDLALGLIGTPPDNSFVFPCPHGAKVQPIDTRALAHAVRRNLAWSITDSNGRQLYDKSGEPAIENRLGVAHFTPHDLRRTANTLMAGSKIIKEHRERVLNHTLEKLDGTYNLYDYDDEKRLALETLSRKIASIVSGTKEVNVVPIHRATGK